MYGKIPKLMKVTTVSRIKGERLVVDGLGAIRRFKRRTGMHLSVTGAGTGLSGLVETALNPTVSGPGASISDTEDVNFYDVATNGRPARVSAGKTFELFGEGEIQVEDTQPKPRQRVLRLKISA